MNKKNVLIILVVVIVLVGGLFLWKSGFLAPTGIKNEKIISPSEIEKESNNQITVKTGSSGKITDDIYIDILVEMMSYQAEKNPDTYAINIKKLYEKYGVTEENLKAYTNELDKDPVRAQAIVQKYTERLAELQK